MVSQQGNGYSEIKSHSSVLFNERINILFTMLDAEGIDMGIKPNINQIMKVKSILEKIWDNLRPLIYYAPNVRSILKLGTTKPGIYTIDSGFAHIQECINHMISSSDYSYTYLVYTIQQLQNVERIIKEVLQYFSYFIRPDYKQMPDFDSASDRYKQMADKRTVEEFKQLIGDRSNDIFDSLDIPISEDYFDEE
jgi:hypothetical protein